MHSWSFLKGVTGLSSCVQVTSVPRYCSEFHEDFLLELDSSLIISLVLGLNPFAHVTYPLTGI